MSRRRQSAGPVVKNKRAVIQQVIAKMQQAVRSRIIKFLQNTYNASGQLAFAVAKEYLRGFKFDQLKQVYYSDLDVQGVTATHYRLVKTRKPKSNKSGLPPINGHNRSSAAQRQQGAQRRNGRPQQPQGHYQQQQQYQQKPREKPQHDRLPNIHAKRSRNDSKNAPGPMTSTRKAPENVWAAIMTYDIEQKRKEDQAKAVAKRRELEEYERALAQQVQERRNRLRREELERREMAEVISKDVLKFKEEAQQKKEEQLRKVQRATRLAAEVEEQRRQRIEDERRRRERAKIKAREELEKLRAIELKDQEERDAKRRRQRDQVSLTLFFFRAHSRPTSSLLIRVLS